MEPKSLLTERKQQRLGKPHRMATQFRLKIKMWGFYSPTKMQQKREIDES